MINSSIDFNFEKYRLILIYFLRQQMQVYDIIYQKRNGEELASEEISYMIHGYTQGEIPDYQMSAFLMAVWYQKLTSKERAQLTMEMLKSGKQIDLSSIPSIKIDKHSTGGVGDGTSLIISPIVAAAGGIVPMMSGRGLGHTGGTLDKLESIPGFNVKLDEKTAIKNLQEIGAAMMGQTDDIVPADKKMYALRDVTATIDSIDLISASIMSKKIAEGMDALVLDVKTGKGAFMQKKENSIALAKSMVEIGSDLNKDMFAYITDMNQPLGKTVGNSLEMIQAIEILKGKGPEDIVEIVLLLSARMLVMCKKAENMEKGRAIAQKMIDSYKALEKLKQIIEIQNGDARVIDDYSLFPQASLKEDYFSPKHGYICDMDALKIGLSAVVLGAGRENMESQIDYGTGYIMHKKLGDKVEKNEPILTIHANDKEKLEKARQMLKHAIQVNDKAVDLPLLVYGYVTKDGFKDDTIPRP